MTSFTAYYEPPVWLSVTRCAVWIAGVLFLIVTRDTPPPVVDALKDALEKELGPPRLAYRQEPLRSFYILAFGT